MSTIEISVPVLGRARCQRMYDLMIEGDFCDLEINVTDASDTQIIKVHRLVLATASRVLREKVCEDKLSVDLDISFGTVREVIRFVYLGKVLINPSKIKELSKLAILWDIMNLIEICEDYNTATSGKHNKGFTLDDLAKLSRTEGLEMQWNNDANPVEAADCDIRIKTELNFSKEQQLLLPDAYGEKDEILLLQKLRESQPAKIEVNVAPSDIDSSCQAQIKPNTILKKSFVCKRLLRRKTTKPNMAPVLSRRSPPPKCLKIRNSTSIFEGECTEKGLKHLCSSSQCDGLRTNSKQKELPPDTERIKLFGDKKILVSNGCRFEYDCLNAQLVNKTLLVVPTSFERENVDNIMDKYGLRSIHESEDKDLNSNATTRSDDHILVGSKYIYPCSVCGSKCGRPLKKHFHEYWKHGVRLPRHLLAFVCGVCGQVRESWLAARDHVKLHIKDLQPFLCQICGAKFATELSLKMHDISRHREEKPHLCPVCAKGFKRTHQLQSHMVTHSAEKPQRCTECDFRTKSRGNLKVHLKNIHQMTMPSQKRRCVAV